MNNNEQVAPSAATIRRRIPLSAQDELGSCVDSGRDPNADASAAFHDSNAMADGTGLVDRYASSSAFIAWFYAGEVHET
jgi:hypothetical protein